jgi:RNA polymerase sigma-70 factor (ECF subfamily)
MHDGAWFNLDGPISMESVWQGPLVIGGRDAARPPDDLFRELFARFYPPVVAFFVRRGFSSDEAADLAQETFKRAFENLATLRDSEAARSWLFTVAINVRRNALRSRKAAKRSGDEVPFDAAAETAGEHAPPNPGREDEESALEKLLTRERAEMLRRALGELPPRMRQAVFLRVDRDLKLREIAEILQVSVDTIKAQMLQARRKLRERLGEHFSNIDL